MKIWLVMETMGNMLSLHGLNYLTEIWNQDFFCNMRHPVAVETWKFTRGWGWKILGLGRVTPSKTHQFWPIYLLPIMDNFALLDFSFPFLIFLFFFLRILGRDMPLLKNYMEAHIPSFLPLPPPPGGGGSLKYNRATHPR